MCWKPAIRFDDALKVLHRVSSHIRYNVVLADATGAAASVELYAGGGAQVQPKLLATNHQNDVSVPDRGDFTRTFQRATHLADVTLLGSDPTTLAAAFKRAPLMQDRYADGFGTLFTAEYDLKMQALTLHWADDSWTQPIDSFTEGQRIVTYGMQASEEALGHSIAGRIDWVAVGKAYASGTPPDWRDFCAPWIVAA